MKFISNKNVSPIRFHYIHGRYIFMLLLVLAWLPAWASSPGKHIHPTRQQEEGQMPSLYKSIVTIQVKSLEHIFTAGHKYELSKETVIVDTNGKEVKLKKMLVPCDAEVSYLFENGVRKVKRIDIKKVLDGARWQWISEGSE